MLALREASFEPKQLVFEPLDSESRREEAPNYCGECFKPIEAALDRDARERFSRDLFCQCGRNC
jgi:hypothetical protein